MATQITAPEIHSRYGWVQGGPYTLQDFKGRFVLLDFWTLGCINCQHILPDLRRLEEEFEQELVIVGIHSAKFPSEQEHHTIAKAIEKFGIRHPILNDADRTLWEHYAIRAWPTVVLIDPEGKIVGQQSGEGVYKALKPILDKEIAAQQSRIIPQTAPYCSTVFKQGGLLFPTKLCIGPEGSLFVADSGHHRILQLTPTGTVICTIGQGTPGFKNGDAANAQFRHPQGMALWRNTLLIADTWNHAVRQVDLTTKEVTTLSGNGTLGYYWGNEAWNTPVLPNSPWDLVVLGDELFIANAGNHQILRVDLSKGPEVYRWAGTGYEALHDALRQEACFNQPSGITMANLHLYIADTEASCVRQIHLLTGKVETLLGSGAKQACGDQDGPFSDSLLQHPVGILAHQNQLYIADTYNGKIKIADHSTQQIRTLYGGLDEPNDLLVLGKWLFITDTHHHRILKCHIETDICESIQIG